MRRKRLATKQLRDCSFETLPRPPKRRLPRSPKSVPEAREIPYLLTKSCIDCVSTFGTFACPTKGAGGVDALPYSNSIPV